MTDVMDQLTGAGATSEEATTPSPTTEIKPASSADGSPNTGEASKEPATIVESPEDFKAKYEESERLRKKAEEAYRKQQDELRRARLERQRLEQERSQRVNDILRNPDLYAEIQSDPAKWNAFNQELVAIRVAEARQQDYQAQVDMEWRVKGSELREWALIDKEGPQMSANEFDEWSSRHGAVFASYGDDVAGAMEAAKMQMRGMYFDRFASKVRETADKSAHEKAMNTIKSGNPPGSSAAAIGKQSKTPTEAWLEDLEAPGTKSIADIFK